MLLRRLYTLFTALLCLFLIHTVTAKPWLQTDLTALLPADAQVDAVWRAADEAGEKQLNGQILLLVGSEDADRAFAAKTLAMEDAAHVRRHTGEGVFAEWLLGEILRELD